MWWDWILLSKVLHVYTPSSKQLKSIFIQNKILTLDFGKFGQMCGIRKSIKSWFFSSGNWSNIRQQLINMRSTYLVSDGLAVCLGGSFVRCVSVCVIFSHQLTEPCKASLQRPLVVFSPRGAERSVFAFSRNVCGLNS